MKNLEKTLAWKAMENDNWEAYDRFVDLLKDTYTSDNKDLGEKIENVVATSILEMFHKLDERFGEKDTIVS